MILIADAGLPMIAIVWPVAWLAFLPVVLVESLVARKVLGLGFRRAIKVTAAANAISTLVGIPISWFALVVLDVVTCGGGPWQAAASSSDKILSVCRHAAWLWPIPVMKGDLEWAVPVAALILCIPFYFASVLIEYIVLYRMVAVPPRQVRRSCWLANLASYSLIVIFWGAMLVASR